MLVLVTGICGFVGSHLGRRLLEEGYDVVSIVRPGSSTVRIEEYRSRIRVIEGDLFDPESYRAGLNQLQPELAIHAAWYAEHGRFWTALENLDCMQMTVDLLRALADAGCSRFVGVGSCAEYAWGEGRLSEERTPCEPSSLYGVAKNSTRALVGVLGAQLGVSSVWARLFFPYGPSEAEERLIPQVAMALLRGERARCSHGRQVRDFIDVRDCADALIALGTSKLTGSVNLGTGVPLTVAAVAHSIAILCGRSGADVELGAIEAPRDDPAMIVADTRKLASCGWRPSFSIEDGLAHSVAWWRKRLE